MKRFLRIMLGKQSAHADECHKGSFIGADFGIEQDLTNHLPEDWREFNHHFRPVYLQSRPEKTKVSAGLACGALWTVSKGIEKGDIVLCPNGARGYFVGEVVTQYSYHPGQILPHRRGVRWYSKIIEKDQMSRALQNSAGSALTVCDVTKYSKELEALIAGAAPPTLISTDESVEDPSVFALETHLEEFLVENWENTEIGKKYDIYEEDGELVGKQYQTDNGTIDILAISKNKKELLVVELKKGRASDRVIGQVQRYMGYVLEELVEDGQTVKGVIIALEDDLSIKRALTVTKNIDFFRYQVSFKLIKAA